MKTKFNIERQFIEGYSIVDPIDTATFQKQIEVFFTGDTAVIDLAKSNFFIIDCEPCSGSTCNIHIINYTEKIQRFEVLLQESLEVKNLNFVNIEAPNAEVHFPFKYEDDEDNQYDIEPMEQQRRNQMLITFRTTHNSDGSRHIVGVTTPWFESSATHSMINLVFEELSNAMPDNESEEHDYAYRYPSNIKAEFYNSKDTSVIIDEGECSFGVFSTFVYRIPDYYEDVNCKHHIKITYYGYNGGDQIIPISKAVINSGMVNIPIQLPSNFINEWEPSHGKDYNQGNDGLAFSDSAMYYREGDLVHRDVSGLANIWRCNTNFPTGIRNINYIPGRYEPLLSPTPETYLEFPFDYMFWDAWRNGNQGWGWYKLDIVYVPDLPNLVEWEYLNPQPSSPPI